MLLEPAAAQAVAVALHELATNAAKYGSLSVAGGKVDLRWSQEADGQLKLRWTESGGPPVQAPTRKGFGWRIIEQMITQLKGTHILTGGPKGWSAKSRFGVERRGGNAAVSDTHDSSRDRGLSSPARAFNSPPMADAERAAAGISP